MPKALPLLQDLQGRLERAHRVAVAGRLDRHGVDETEEGAATRRPLGPRAVKYSAFARKRTRRGTASGITTLSMKLRWLLAMITGPSGGTCPTPSTRGRQTTRKITPTIHRASV